jgi:hypothetical protein
MASITQSLRFVSDRLLQKVLTDLFGSLISTAPAAITAVAPAAVSALAPPAGGTGATAGAYDTAANRDLMIASVTTLRTNLIATRAEVAKLVTDIAALRATVATLTNISQ